MTDYATLQAAANAADAAWSAELHRQFGKRAGTVRYLPAGCAGPVLAPLHAEFRRATAATHAWWVAKWAADRAARAANQEA